MKSLILLLCFSFCLAKNRLVVVSFDGFRYDFIDRGVTPNLHAILNESTVAKFMVNIFPTQTFPNHFSIATGLYAENHGVLQSQVYDEKENKLLKYGYDLWHYDNSVLPLWDANERQGGVSGVSMWPGSDFAYNGTNQTYSLKYNQSVAFNERVDTAVKWLKHPTKPANLVFMYFEEPDKHGHAYGPSAPQTNEQIRRVDAVAGYLLDSLAKNGLNDTNVVFLSDHGMEGVYKKDIINLETFVGKTAKFYGTSPALQVYPEKGKEEEVFKILDLKSKELKNFRVFKRNDIPEHFHYKKCKRSPPILALADPKYAFQDLYSGIEWYMDNFNVSDVGPFGVHGYDPLTIEMHPYFIASGPMFKKNFRPPELYTVDMSLLFARVLGLDTSKIRSDGSLDRINSVLTSSSTKFKHFGIVVIGVILFIIMAITISCFIMKRQKSIKADSGEYIKVDIDDDDEIL